MTTNAPCVVHQSDETVLWSATSGPFRNNTYLVVDVETGDAALVDPFFDCVQQWESTLNSLSHRLGSVLITHGHIDHVGGLASVESAFPGVRIFAHEDGLPLMTAEDVPTLTGGIASLSDYSELFNLPMYETTRPTDILEDGFPYFVGKTRLDILSTPGHCPGHVSFSFGNVLISGDVLYKGAVGFTHIPQSDPGVLADTLLDTILPLGDDVVVYSGHGDATTIGQERRSNSFILEALERRE